MGIETDIKVNGITLSCQISPDEKLSFDDFDEDHCWIAHRSDGTSQGECMQITKADAKKLAETLLLWANS